MLSDYRCFYCFTKAFGRLLDKEDICPDLKNAFTNEMISLYQQMKGNFSAPSFSGELHKIYSRYTGNNDPYSAEKKRSNDTALQMYQQLKRKIETSENPFNTAMRIAIACNIIDFAVNDFFNLESSVGYVLNGSFSIDHSDSLKKCIEKAGTVLYLGDNAGEIVFDRLFVETINHHGMVFAVRGFPVINDATMEDAEYTGINKTAKVISNGHFAPSTVLDKCSDEFKETFNSADIIISKGQGNLEGLFNVKNKRIFFLLLAKCGVVAEFLGFPKGSIVVYDNSK